MLTLTKKILFILLLLLGLHPALYAQREGKAFIDSLMRVVDGKDMIDALLSKLAATKRDSDKIVLLDALSFFSSDIDPDAGIKYGTQALDLTKKTGSKKYLLANVYGNIGINYLKKSEYPKGMEYLFLSLKTVEETKNKKSIDLRLYNISSAYFNISNYPKALEYSQKAMQIAGEIKDTAILASCLSNMGAIYGDIKKPDTALIYLFKALPMLERNRDKPVLATTLEHISATYSDMRNDEKAIEYGQKALDIYKDIDDLYGITVGLLNMGNIYMRAVKDSVADNPYKGDEQRIKKAITYFEQCAELDRQIQNADGTIDVSHGLAEAYEMLGNYKDALKYYRISVATKDSVYSNDNKVKLARLETKREEELKDKQIEINKLENVFYAVGIALLLVVILVVVRNFRIQKKANKVKEELLAQKDILMKEIHHRVKNNLQVISTLLDLQLTNITDEQAKDAMTESTTRVRSISLIHQQLYQNENITSIEFSKFAKDLMQQVTNVFQKAGPPVILESNMPETVLDIDTAVPLGLILNELMTNSYKYAFANTGDGKMEIILEQKDGQYRLLYKDSGPGLPEGLDVSKLKSLGIKVMRGLSKQIGGTFNYIATDKSFVITFKNVAGRKLID